MSGAREEGQRERRARLLEVSISVIASVITSAVVVAWTISATLARMQARIDEHAAAIIEQSDRLNNLRDKDQAQGEAIATVEAHYADILRRLDSIDRKLER